LGFSRSKTGELVPDVKAFNELFLSQTAGKEFVTSYEAEALADPKNPFTILKTGLDKQLAQGTISEPDYNSAMQNNRFAHVVVPQLGGLSGLPTRFPQVTSLDRFAAQLTDDAKKRLEYRKAPDKSDFAFYRKDKSGLASYTAPEFNISIPPSDQKANERITVTNAKVYDQTTGNFKNLTDPKVITEYGTNTGITDNRIGIVPEIIVRETQNFKVVDRNGKQIPLKYNPTSGSTFDPVELAKEFQSLKGVKLVGRNGQVYPNIESFLSNQNAIVVNPMFKVDTMKEGNQPNKTLADALPSLFFRADQKPELKSRWNKYSRTSFEQLQQNFKTLPLEILRQYSGGKSTY
jgi:hypothetical protein